MSKFKARYKTDSDKEFQLLADCLNEIGMYVELFAKEIGLPKPALLIGLLRDLGKNCKLGQDYLDEKIISIKIADRKDHASAGGQYLELIRESKTTDITGGLRKPPLKGATTHSPSRFTSFPFVPRYWFGCSLFCLFPWFPRVPSSSPRARKRPGSFVPRLVRRRLCSPETMSPRRPSV
jgi:hypothetical protein